MGAGSPPGADLPDEELVRRVVSGDRDAFSAIVLRYQDRIFTVCLRMLGSESAAEEVAQEVFLAAYRNMASFRGDAKLSTWLYRVAINHCKNRRLYEHRRAAGRHEPLEGLPRDDEPIRELADPGPGTDEALHRSEAARLVQDALADLDPDHRNIVLLRDVDGLPYEDIADILDLPRGTVKSRLHRARAQLGKALSRFLGRADIFE